jgi:Zn-dependent protease with chaperone function
MESKWTIVTPLGEIFEATVKPAGAALAPLGWLLFLPMMIIVMVVGGLCLVLLVIGGAFSPLFIIRRYPLLGAIMLVTSVVWAISLSLSWINNYDVNNPIFITYAVLFFYLIVQVFIVQWLRNKK